MYPTEADLLNDAIPENIADTTTGNTSKIVMLNSTRKFKVGDIVTFNIIAHDGRGNRRHRGGDIIRLWMRTNDKNLTSLIGTVTDNRNGTYKVSVLLLLPGAFKVEAMVAYSRETVSAQYRIRRLGARSYFEHGHFRAGNISETSFCSPLRSELETSVCNLTNINHGMPFFCGRPQKTNLSCQDWQYSDRIKQVGFSVPFTIMEKQLLGMSHIWQHIPVSISVTVLPGKKEKKPPCNTINTQLLWNQVSPVGFFKNGVWSNVLCEAKPDLRRYKKCFRGKKVIFFGDSLSRQMFEDLARMMDGRITTKWNKGVWHRPLNYKDTVNNLTAMWVAHSLPFSSSIRVADYNKGISNLFDEIGSEENAVIIISHHTHILPYHQSVFKERLDIYRRAISSFLKRNPHAIVFVKGVSAWKSAVRAPSIIAGCFGELYNNLIRCVFSDLSERFIYLDHMDMTIMAESEKLHPPPLFVREFMHNMIGFIC